MKLKSLVCVCCVLLSALGFSQQEKCDSIVWNFGVNQFAIDGDELIADLASKGWDKTFFQTNSVKVKITGATDCPGTYQYNTKLAGNRAVYLRNYFEMAGFPDVKIEECNAVPERGCTRTRQGYHKEDRCVALILCWKESERSAEVNIEHIPVSISEDTAQAPLKKLDAINELQPGQTLVLEGLTFYPGSHRTLPEAKPVMKELLTIMQENPNLVIEIQGHVCCGKRPEEDGRDDETGDMKLSWNRAKFVYDYLIRNGVDQYRVTYKGYAMTHPKVFPEVTIQDQIINRRVEVKVISK